MIYGEYYYQDILNNYDEVIVADGKNPAPNDRVELYDDMQEVAFIKVLY